MTVSGEHHPEHRVVTVPATGDVEREEFGARQIERKAETASAALAAQAEAAVKARFVMAMQRPRNIDLVRVKLLAACKRPMFAENAIYSKPVGREKNENGEWVEKFAEGLNIRFAEEAVRVLGNAMTETSTLYDDPKKRIIRVSATDLETNVVHYKDLTVEKTVERRYLKKGQQSLGMRLNSYGDQVHLVEATEDDLAKKEGGLASKAMRDKILMLIPSDIKEECKAQIYATQADKDAKDPEAAKRAVLDAFASRGILPDQLSEFVGHDMTALTPAELQKLRAIYSAINDGEATWADVIEQKRDFEKEKAEKDKKKEGNGTVPAAGGKTSLTEVAAAARAKREGKTPGGTTPAPAAAGPPPGHPASADNDPPDDTRGDDPMLDGMPGHPRRR
jgi:hypothetical protein